MAWSKKERNRSLVLTMKQANPGGRQSHGQAGGGCDVRDRARMQSDIRTDSRRWIYRKVLISGGGGVGGSQSGNFYFSTVADKVQTPEASARSKTGRIKTPSRQVYQRVGKGKVQNLAMVKWHAADRYNKSYSCGKVKVHTGIKSHRVKT